MAMARPLFLLACAFAFLASSCSSAAVVEHTFYVQKLTVQLLCHQQVITTVNGSLPGPIIQVHEGDTLLFMSLTSLPIILPFTSNIAFYKLDKV
ncbi:hypothetical protein CsSME_00017391 [Camellia sinensis var. sinensis]